MEFDIDLIRSYAADNRLRFGKASFKPVMGKIIATKPEYKAHINDLIKVVKEVIEEVNEMPLDEVEDLASRISRVKRGREEFKLPPLPNATEGKVATRFAPNPDFVLHLGSLRPLILSYEYARMYNGKFYIRFEDTDPKTKKPEPQFYELILKDIEWLGIKPDKIVYQSDRLNLYYDVGKCLINKGHAYVCLCGKDEFKEYIYNGKPCPHRMQSVEDNLELFDKMLSNYFGEGEAVLRVKTDLNHPNQSVRDWPALRIIDVDKYPHPRKGDKYGVWPLYNFSCAVDDHMLNITHVLRGAEHRVNEIKQEFIFKYMGWEIPIYIHHGRVAIPEGILSKSKILKGIKEGVYKGIDDPRLATLASFRRRGYHPKALYNVILKTGVSLSNTTIDFSMLAAENKKIIDKDANRFYGVRNPSKFKVHLPRETVVRIRLHPDFPERGYRIYRLSQGENNIYLDYADAVSIKDGDFIRLIALGNFRVSGDGLEFVNNDVKWARDKKIPFIHWVSEAYCIDGYFIYPGEEYKGVIEESIKKARVGDLIQLERLGYFKIEYENKYVQVIFTHK